MSRINRLTVFVVVLSTFAVTDSATSQILRLPFVNIDRSNGQVRVQAPFVDVYRGNGVTSVRAPFTNVVRQTPQVRYYRTPYGLRPYYVYPQQTYVPPQTTPRYNPQQLQNRSYRPNAGTNPGTNRSIKSQPTGPILVPPTPVPDAIGRSPQVPPPTPGAVPLPRTPAPDADRNRPQLIPIPQTPLDALDTLDQLDPSETPDASVAQQPDPTQPLLTPPTLSERRVAKPVGYALTVEIDSAVTVLNSQGGKAPTTAQTRPKEDEDGFVVIRSRSNKGRIQQVSDEVSAAESPVQSASDAGRIDEQPHYSLVLQVKDGDDVPKLKIANRTTAFITPASGSTSYRLIAIPHSDLEDHFQPAAGVHVFALIHPATREPLVVKLQVPAGKPNFDLRRDRVVLKYDDVERTVFFTSDGDVIVKEQ